MYYDELTDYFWNIVLLENKKVVPVYYWVTNHNEPQWLDTTAAKELLSNTTAQTNPPSGVVVQVVNVTLLLNTLVHEMHMIPKAKQVQFKHGDDSETVALLTNLQETERNKKKIDNMKIKIKNQQIDVMSQANKVLILEREDNPNNRTQLFLSRSELWKLKNIVVSSEEELKELISKDDAVWDDVVHQELSQVDQNEEEKTNMSNSIDWNYSEDVSEQLQIFQMYIKEEHIKYVRKLKVVAAIGKTYAQQMEERKHWAANLLQFNFRNNKKIRIEKEKAQLILDQKREERRIRKEKRDKANEQIRLRREKEKLTLEKKMKDKKQKEQDRLALDELNKKTKYQQLTSNNRFRKTRKKTMKSRWNRWGLFVLQQRSKKKRLTENYSHLWKLWTQFVVVSTMRKAVEYKASCMIQRMVRSFIVRNFKKIMARKKKEQEEKLANFMRKIKYGYAQVLFCNWYTFTCKMKRVRGLMGRMDGRWTHTCFVGWRTSLVLFEEERQNSSRIIQRAWRNRNGFVAYMLKNLQTSSSCSIQRSWRAYCIRTCLGRAIRHRERQEHLVKKMLFQMQMKILIDGFDIWYEEAYKLKVLRKFCGKKSAAIIEEHFDAWSELHARQRKACCRIQSTWRSFDARVKLAHVFLVARSSRKIQGCIRVFLAKNTVFHLKLYRDSSTRIQTTWRTKKCKIDLNTRFVNELLDAAKDKNYIRVEEFFQKGRGTLSNREGTTCLHVAANVGSKRIIKLCLRNGMDLDTRDLRGRTPLHYLVEGSYPGQEVLLEYLVSKGSRRNAVDVIGNSILAEASRLDHLECVISLIAMSVDVNSQDIQGFTPIHVAAASNAWASVKALIGMGHADVDLPDYEGCTPLHDVCAKGYSAVLSLLLPHVHNMNVQDYQGMTPLHHAINGINEECVRIFLENGGNTEIQDHFGTFPIHLTSQDNRRCHILTMLCESFTHLDVVDNDNQTALHLACIANVPEVVTILLGFGAEPNVRDSSGCQPIHLASRHGSVECCQILFDYNVDINIKNYDGISALGEARMSNQTEVIDLFNNRYIRSSVINRQKEVTLATNLGVAPPVIVEEPLNVGELQPGDHLTNSTYWKQVLGRSLKYRVVAHWTEYREVLPPKDWILNQRVERKQKEAKLARILATTGVEPEAEEEEVYALKHWWENNDTGACTFQTPETILMGEWVVYTSEIETKRTQEDQNKQDQPDSTGAAAGVAGGRGAATKWINLQTNEICIGVPPTHISVSAKRTLEPISLPNNVSDSLSLVDYQSYFNKEKALLDQMTLDWNSCVIVQTYYRAYKGRCLYAYMKRSRASVIQIQKHVRGMLSRERVRVMTVHKTTTITLQRRRRGEMTRRYLKFIMPQLIRRRNIVASANLINRLWRGYYPRRQRRRLWWRKNGPTNNTEWNQLRNNTKINDLNSYLSVGSYVVRKSVLQKYDCLAVGSGYGCDQGSYDMTSDVMFWYNRIRGKEPKKMLLDRLGVLFIYNCYLPYWITNISICTFFVVVFIHCSKVHFLGINHMMSSHTTKRNGGVAENCVYVVLQVNKKQSLKNCKRYGVAKKWWNNFV